MMNNAVYWSGLFHLTSKVIDFLRLKKLANIYQRQILRFVHQCNGTLKVHLSTVDRRTLAIYSENMAGFHYFLLEAQQPYATIERFVPVLQRLP
jgi:hypothetical protein